MIAELNAFASGDWAPWQQLAEEHSLVRGLRALAASGDQEQIQECERQLAGENASLLIARYYGSDRHHIDIDRLWKNARALSAVARAAASLRRSDWPQFLESWYTATAVLNAGAQPARSVPSPQWTNAPEMWLDATLPHLSNIGWPLASLRQWTLYMLGVPEPNRSISVWILGAIEASKQGFLLRLHIADLGDSPAGLSVHPESALWPLGSKFIETLKSQYVRHAHPRAAGWSLELPTAMAEDTKQLKGRPWVSVDGSSLGAAAAAAFHLLAQESRTSDLSCAMTAAVGSEAAAPLKDKLSHVELIDAKLDAVRKWNTINPTKPIARVGMTAEDQRAVVGDQGVEIRAIRTVADAVELASGLLSGLIRLIQGELDRVLDDATNRLRRHIDCWEALDRIFVPVKVARGLRPHFTDEEYRELEQQHQAEGYGAVDRLVMRRLDLRFQDRQRELARPVVSWETLRAGVKHAIVLGDPGYGKTTLIWHEVARRNSEWLEKLRRGKAGAHEAEPAVFVRAIEAARWLVQEVQDAGLLETVAGNLWKMDDPAASLMLDKLRTGRALLCLDALDEVPHDLRPRLTNALRECGRHNGVKLLLSSRLVGYAGVPGVIGDQDQLEVLAFEHPQMRKAVEGWFAQASRIGEEAWLYFENQRQVFEALRCPFLLRLACQLVEAKRRDGYALPPWKRRGDLYASLIEITHALVPLGDARGSLVLFEEDLALELWLMDARCTLWDFKRLYAAVRTTRAQHPELDRRDLIRDLCATGILVRTGPELDNAPLMFTHRSFGEYLAACALARRLAEDEQWWKVVESKSWDPDWQEVLIFAAGELREPDWNPKGLSRTDDLFHHRVTLLALCLAEMSAPNIRVVNAVTDIVFGAFWKRREDGTWAVQSHLSKGVLVAAKLFEAIHGIPLVREFEAMFDAAAVDVGARPLFNHLATVLWDRPWIPVLTEMLELLSQDDAAAITIRSVLLSVLRDKTTNLNDRAKIAGDLWVLAESTVGNKVVSAVALDLVGDRSIESIVRRYAAEALSMAEQNDTTVLLEVLKDKSDDSGVREEIAEVLGRYGKRGLRDPEVSAVLLKVLEDKADDSSVRSGSAKALGLLGPGVIEHAETVTALLKVLRNKSEGEPVRSSAAEALGKLAHNVMPSAEVREALLNVLQDAADDSFVRSSAAEALVVLAVTGMCPGVSAVFFKLLYDKDEDSHVREGAAQSLAILVQYGGDGATVSSALLSVLRDKSDDPDIRGAAAEAFAEIADRVANSGTKSLALLKVLQDPTDDDVHRRAADALGRLQAAGFRYFQKRLGKQVRHIGDLSALDPDFLNRLRRRAARRFVRLPAQ